MFYVWRFILDVLFLTFCFWCFVLDVLCLTFNFRRFVFDVLCLKFNFRCFDLRFAYGIYFIGLRDLTHLKRPIRRGQQKFFRFKWNFPVSLPKKIKVSNWKLLYYITRGVVVTMCVLCYRRCGFESSYWQVRLTCFILLDQSKNHPCTVAWAE
jgi:hypothetical protein